MSRDDASVAHNAAACRRIIRFMSGIDRSTWLDDDEKQSTVIYQLVIIGEAAGRLSPDFRQLHSAVPWSKTVAMRNVLVHNFNLVDLDIVWDTVAQDVPRLLAYVEPLLHREQQAG